MIYDYTNRREEVNEMNYLAIIIAGILNMAIGAAWYSPMLFAKPWMKAMGFDQKAMDASMKKEMQKKL